MSNISGSFSAYVRAETTLFAEDQPNHQLQLSEIHATQKSPDPSWNNARLTRTTGLPTLSPAMARSAATLPMNTQMAIAIAANSKEK